MNIANHPLAQTALFRLVAAGSFLLALYSLRFLLVGWTAGIDGHVFLFSSPVVAADLAAVPWPQQLLRLLVVIGDVSIPILLLTRPRIALYLAPCLLIAAQAGSLEAIFTGANYAVHATVEAGSSVAWTDLLDWLKIVLRLLVIGGVFYLALTSQPEKT